MKVVVAGASGAIGRPIVQELVRQGHAVTGLTRSERGLRFLQEAGAEAVTIDLFDREAVLRLFDALRPDAVIDELTALPARQSDIPAAAAEDQRIRLEGGGNLLRAANATGVRRYIQQSSGFFVQPGAGLADESEGMAVNASPGVADKARTYAELERRLFADGEIEGVALRYGFYYGPGTRYRGGGAAAEDLIAGRMPIIGDGAGVWNWIHIDDAAIATARALTIAPGIFHITDDEPAMVRDWLPAFAEAIGAPAPPRLSEQEALQMAGADAVYYQTRLRGVSNAKAKAAFGFAARPRDWRAV